MILLFTKRSASQLIRRIQNRISSQKVRKVKDCKLGEFEQKIENLEKENKQLKVENGQLKTQLAEVSKQASLYSRAISNSLSTHHDYTKPDVVVVDCSDEGVYRRIEDGNKGKNVRKAFLLLTVFTILVQTVGSGTPNSSLLNPEERSSKLNFANSNSIYSSTGSSNMFDKKGKFRDWIIGAFGSKRCAVALGCAICVESQNHFKQRLTNRYLNKSESNRRLISRED